MTITAKKITLLEQQPSADGKPVNENHLGLVGEVEVECLVRIGTLTLTINELRQLKQGECLSLKQKTHDPVDILLNNHVIARGELMCAEDCFAIHVTEVTG